jgi:hypothetical protein
VIHTDPLAERLDAFLARRGTTHEALVAAIDEPFGRPLLVVAAGSVLHGFGNERSDVDVNVVVDRDVTRLPIGSYAHDVLVDTKYFSAGEVEGWIATIRDDPWPPARLDRDGWVRRQAEIINCSRFACGLALSAQEQWRAWLAAIREPWLAERIVQWWRLESLRRELAARWLAPAKPLLAAVRAFESVLAALESRVAAAGQLYYGPKWLSEKLCIIDDTLGQQTLEEALRFPRFERDAPSYIAACTGMVASARPVGGEQVRAQLWLLPGVRIQELDGRTLVSRWNLRGAEVSPSIALVARGGEPVWDAPLDAPPPPHVATLFTEDMTWLSIAATPA